MYTVAPVFVGVELSEKRLHGGLLQGFLGVLPNAGPVDVMNELGNVAQGQVKPDWRGPAHLSLERERQKEREREREKERERKRERERER